MIEEMPESNSLNIKKKQETIKRILNQKDSQFG